tara:strand:- start:49 stop:2166 length:2118 start_codon:yes stop_codon:yes gene_type:complete
MITDATIVNADISATAAIALSKLAAVSAGQILVGASGTGAITAVTVSGDIALTSAGAFSYVAGSIVNADINASAAISASKIDAASTSQAGCVQLSSATTSTSATKAATPAAIKICKDAADAAQTTADLALPKAGGSLSNNLILTNAKQVRFSELTANGSHFVSLQAPDTLAADVSYTLPSAAPTANGQVLASTTGGVLSWTEDPTGGWVTSGNDISYNDGRVLIGDAASSSVALLTVEGYSGGGTGQGVVYLQKGAVPTGADQLGEIRFADSAQTVGSKIVGGATGTWGSTNKPSDLKFYTKKTTSDVLALTLDEDQNATFTGNVGIGTTSPATPLHVKHATTNGVATFESGDTVCLVYFKDDSTTSGVGIGATGNDLKLVTGDANRLTILNTGYCGIGEESPDLPLHIKHATSNGILKVESGDSECGITIADNSGQASVRAIGNDLTFNTSSSETERMRIDSDGDLWVGLTPVTHFNNRHAFFHNASDNLVSITSGSGATAGIVFGDSAANTTANYESYIAHYNVNDSLYLYTDQGQKGLELKKGGDVIVIDGNLVVADGHGIDFSANSNAGGMTSELLDSYEEGTWTPTDGSGASLSFSNTSGNCKYTKIGRTVIASFRVTYPSTSNTSTAVIGGFPFNCIALSHNGHGATIAEHTDEPSTTMVMQQSNSTMLILHCNNGVDVRQNNECSGEDYRGSVVYQTA